MLISHEISIPIQTFIAAKFLSTLWSGLNDCVETEIEHFTTSEMIGASLTHPSENMSNKVRGEKLQKISIYKGAVLLNIFDPKVQTESVADN